MICTVSAQLRRSRHAAGSQLPPRRRGLQALRHTGHMTAQGPRAVAAAAAPPLSVRLNRLIHTRYNEAAHIKFTKKGWFSW